MLAFTVSPEDYQGIPANKDDKEGCEMSDEINGGPSTNFWIIGAAALVWNLIGLVFYYLEVTATPESLASLTEAQQAFMTSKPAWATSAFAIAVTTGVLGSLLLLLRKGLAVLMFMVSLAGILVQNVHAFVLANGLEVWGTGGLALPAALIVIAVALLLYARAAKAKHWLG